MKKEELLAHEVVMQLVSDLRDRQGLGDEFESIDEKIQDEIIEAWKNIILNFYGDL